MAWKHGTKPVIGITGGIGSGKSTVAQLFAREGCAVIDSDALAHDVLRDEAVKAELCTAFGAEVLAADGAVDRQALGRVVFRDPAKRARLNGLIHPKVAQMRDAWMQKNAKDPAVRAIVWDTPLLMETGLNRECDAVVYVEVPRQIRLTRVQKSRGWSDQELALREKSQIPLDKKAAIADYCIDNSGDEVASLNQVRRVLSQLFASTKDL